MWARSTTPAASVGPERIAREPAQAYLECVTVISPEWNAIDATMEAYRRRTREHHAVFYAEAIQRVSDLDRAALRRRCVGLIGA